MNGRRAISRLAGRSLGLTAALLLAGGCGAGVEAELGLTDDEAIVNGTATPGLLELTAGQIAAIGALVAQDGTRWSNVCTGTLISPTVVLTAAHCVYDERAEQDVAPSALRFAVGADAAAPTARLAPTVVRSHPDYDPTGDARYDVAVMVLGGAATTGLSVTPIPHYCGALSSATLVGQWVQNVGYGETGGADGEDNSRRWWASEKVTALSSYDFTVDGQGVAGVCYGDSGGPALWHVPNVGVRVIGDLSWGDEECARRDHFARTDAHCAFIDAFVTDAAPPPPPPPATTPTDGCTIEGVSFTAAERDAAFAFFTTMTCATCDELFDPRTCEDAIDDAGQCQLGDSCTGCGDGDGRDDGVSCAEIAGYAYFGATAAAALLERARAAVPGDVTPVTTLVEGVSFTAAEATAVLALVNRASVTELDVDAGLDARAAEHIVAARPIASLEALAAIPYVGAAALEKLRLYVAVTGG